MTGLRITTSNMMEILVARLADVMSAPLKSPLSGEIILINSRGMERWLSMRLADYHGICANVSFSFPRPFLMGLLEKAVGSAGSTFYLPDYLTWKLMEILPSVIHREAFREIRHYLSGDRSTPSTKLYQLCRRIARVFDEYLVYRPEMILNWEAGRTKDKDEIWQAELWRLITSESAERHPAALFTSFKRNLQSSASASLNLPQRISLVGISALPPLFIDMLSCLASHTEVNLFLFNPCREDWSGIRSDKEMESTFRRVSGNLEASPSRDNLLPEGGNPLLASMGRVNRDFLNAFADILADHQDFFVFPGESTLLRSLQSDILNLVDRGKGEDTPIELSEEDASLEIHSCHSPLREVEVLYDRLLSLFDGNGELLPRDILVMTPDIDAYAPLIESVFNRTKEENVGGGESHIPFSIADRKHLGNNPLADTFFNILNLPEGRYEATGILSLLDNQAVRDAFSIAEDDLPLIRCWVEESGIRWGIDADTLIDLGLPPHRTNTWRYGMDRMLLGYALPGEDRHLFGDILPYDAIEGENAQVLGFFFDFLDQLFTAVSLLKKTHTLKQWREILVDIVERFFDIKNDEDRVFDHRHLLDALGELSTAEDISGFDQEVSLAVIREHLKGRLEAAVFSRGFLTGGVTFCAMVPMRNIPFKVICLLGMNHQSFPRESVKLGFDLIDRHPRRGDQTKRDDDRYLFLETLLSARERLLIFYTGQSLRDNTVIPPTVVVAELLDYIEQAFTVSPTRSIKAGKRSQEWPATRSRLTTEHPLQAFSPGNFTGADGMFSYSGEDCLAARSLIGLKAEPRPFLSHSLSLSPDHSRNILLAEFIRFFRNPALCFAEKALGIRLRKEEDDLEDTELFRLSGLTKYTVGNALLEKKIEGSATDGEYRILLRSGKLPLGMVGQIQYETLAPDINLFAEQILQILPAARRQQMPIEVCLGDYYLNGQIDLWSPRGFFAYRYGDLKGKDHLSAWLKHLILNMARPDQPWENYLASPKERLLFTEPDKPADHLIRLLDLFREGLTKPLRFFPQTSLAYVKALKSGKPQSAALDAARAVWQGTDFSRGEGEDPYCRLCFGRDNPLDEEFCRLAEAIYQPLLSHQQACPLPGGKESDGRSA